MSKPSRALLRQFERLREKDDPEMAHVEYDNALAAKLEELDPEWIAAMRAAYGTMPKWFA